MQRTRTKRVRHPDKRREPKGFGVVTRNEKEEMEREKLEKELSEACKDWRELHEFLQKGKMGFWLKLGRRPGKGGAARCMLESSF